MKRNTQSSSWECCLYISHKEWIPPSILSSIPSHSCSKTHAFLVSGPSTSSLHFSIIYLRVYLTLTSMTPGCLLIPIDLPTIVSIYSSQDGWWFSSHSMKESTITHRCTLASYPFLHPITQLLQNSCLLGFWSLNLQLALLHHLSPRIPDSDQYDSRVLIDSNWPPYHCVHILFPGWMVIF